jgi:hypothetical protein
MVNGLTLSIVTREDESDVGVSLDVKDFYGITHYQSHVVLVNILKQWELIQHKKMGIPTMGINVLSCWFQSSMYLKSRWGSIVS